MTGRKYLAAVAQIDTTQGWERSLAAAASFVDQAADAGASLGITPPVRHLQNRTEKGGAERRLFFP